MAEVAEEKASSSEEGVEAEEEKDKASTEEDREAEPAEEVEAMENWEEEEEEKEGEAKGSVVGGDLLFPDLWLVRGLGQGSGDGRMPRRAY